MKRLLNSIAHAVSWYCVYWFTYMEMLWHSVDAYLFAHQGREDLAADSECKMYDCQRWMQDMQINKRYGGN